jgi:hypothetical protein
MLRALEALWKLRWHQNRDPILSISRESARKHDEAWVTQILKENQLEVPPDCISVTWRDGITIQQWASDAYWSWRR